MDHVRMLISYNGRWNELPDVSERYVGALNKGVYVRKNLTYEELLGVVKAIVKYDLNRYEIDIQSISVGPDSTCRTMIADDDDIQFLLGEDKVILKVCVTLVERRCEEHVIGDDFEMNQNHVETRQSNNVVHDSYEAIEVDAPHTVPQFDCQLEQPLDDRYDTGDGPEQHHTSGRRVEGEFISSSNNTITWVIPGSESFSFGDMSTMGPRTPNTMIYKGQFFPRKKDLKRLVGIHALRENYEWKVKRSNKSVLHLVCKHENCNWKLRAVRVSEGTYFHVRSYQNKHTCPLEEVHRRHRQASAIIIGEIVAPRLQDHDRHIMVPRDIIADMKSTYGIQL